MIELGINRGPVAERSLEGDRADSENDLRKQESKERVKITEAEFYQQRYQAIADRRNKSLGKLFGRKVTAEEVATEFEKLKQEDLERRKHPEFQEWQPSLKLVLEHFKANRDHTGMEKKPYRILIFGCGGGMRGPLGAGHVAGLNEVGLTANKADVLVGISAGLANLFYYAGGKLHTLRGAAIYYHQCATKAFLNLLRLHHVMDARVVGDVMKDGPQKIDQYTVRNGPEIYAGITPKDDPSAPVEFVDMKKARSGLLSPAIATMNVPILFAPGVKVNMGSLTIEYIDGAFGSIPIEELIEKFNPTDILVLPNVPFQRIEDFKSAPKWAEKLPRVGSIGTVRKFLQVSSELRKLLDYFQKEKGVNIGMLWPPERGLATLNNDPDVVQLGIYDTIKDTIEQCGEKLPKTIEMYLPKEDKYLEVELAA